ncbi:chemotaxis protein CheD [Ectothiorhodospira magna]|uniref:Probable chemoreceptor glutamine deamidase CheD n=1 Tax=Ectothiorhodospira magna TaxID=867345 RepID=A0A1H9A7F1_9GAMM|nr:chemoreceptor glutamine deamidase CheD [Ectothiorhodospira magna]SEP72461.1 chemotaxis protein CheD [Ectothiorhodospira magna]
MSKSFEEVLASNHYFDRHFQTEAVKVLPGEYYVSGPGPLMVTVLGSCVGACIRDRVSGIGGMNHFMLPDDKREEDARVGSAMRYGDYAMEILINEVLKKGARRSQLEAKLFGGGNVMQGFTQNIVGERNARFAVDYLKTEGIPVVARDLMGNYPRKVYFFPADGRVLVRKLRTLRNDTILEREMKYRQRLRQAPLAGDVELFS